MSNKIVEIEYPHIKINMASVEDVGKAVKSVLSDGIWWKQIKKLCWWPLDFNSTINIGPKPPKFRNLMYQHITYPKDANSFIKYMVIDNLQDYNLQMVGPKTRNAIRQSLKNLEIRKIEDFDENEAEQAKNCWNNLVERTAWRQKMDKDVFSCYWNSLLSLPGHTILCAYHEKKLVGWLVGIAFDNGNCYLTRYASLAEYFNLRVNNGLIYIFLMSAKNSDANRVNFGLCIPNNPNLDKFKQSMGFKITTLSAYTYINPLLKRLVIKIFKTEIDRVTNWY